MPSSASSIKAPPLASSIPFANNSASISPSASLASANPAASSRLRQSQRTHRPHQRQPPRLPCRRPSPKWFRPVSPPAPWQTPRSPHRGGGLNQDNSPGLVPASTRAHGPSLRLALGHPGGSSTRINTSTRRKRPTSPDLELLDSNLDSLLAALPRTGEPNSNPLILGNSNRISWLSGQQPPHLTAAPPSPSTPLPTITPHPICCPPATFFTAGNPQSLDGDPCTGFS